MNNRPFANANPALFCLNHDHCNRVEAHNGSCSLPENLFSGEDTMWTLILYGLLISTVPGGGVETSSTVLKFESEDQCHAALKSAVTSHSVRNRAAKEVGVFSVRGQCIANAK